MNIQRIKAKAVCTYSNAGNRPAQENFVLCKQEKGIFALADGFGGITPGAQASKTACESVLTYLQKEAGDLEATMPFVLRSYFSLAGNVLFNSLIHANRKVMDLNKKKNIYERGGASVIAGFIDENRIALANVGSCSAWLVRNQKLISVVTPRTYEKLYDPFTAQSRTPLTALGMYEDLEPEVVEIRLEEGDWLFLHTDNLGPEIQDAILEENKKKQGAAEAARAIESILKSAVFQDNVTLSAVIF